MKVKLHPDYHILMGDIVGSSSKPSQKSALDLENVVSQINKQYADKILSPLTITLGDEFQGVIKDAHSVIEIILDLERRWLNQEIYELHYAWVKGQIETSINTEIAHGMLGTGLTKARQMLANKARDRRKFQILILNEAAELGQAMEDQAFALEGLSAQWNPKDYPLVLDLLSDLDINSIAQKYSRDTSSVYRRRETLMTQEYKALRSSLFKLADYIDQRWP